MRKENVRKHIVSYEACIGCGICVNVCPVNCINMIQEADLSFKPKVNESKCISCRKCIEVCPDSYFFYNEIENEIERESFKKHPLLGNYINTYYGYVKNEKERTSSASGGIITALLKYLLNKKIVDGIISVRADELIPNRNVFAYTYLCRTLREIEKSRGSKYISVSYNNVLKKIKKENLNVAIVATPCIIAGMRKLQIVDKVYKERIKFLFSFTCGHVCKPIFVKKLMEYSKVKEYDEIRFRSKKGAKYAEDYKFEILEKDSTKTLINFVDDIYGQLWNFHAFTEEKCLRCNDIFARYADIVVMDAWNYSKDRKGQSFIITRNKYLDELLHMLGKKNILCLKEVEEEKIVKSQSLPVLEKSSTLRQRIYLLRKIGKIGKYSLFNKSLLQKPSLNLYYSYHNISLYLRVKFSNRFLAKRKLSYRKLLILRILFDPFVILKKIVEKVYKLGYVK